MPVPRRLTSSLFVLALLIAACGESQPQGDGASPEGSPEEPPAAAAPGEITFEDDFSSAEDGWLGGETDTDFAAYQEGRLHVFVREGGVSVVDTGGVFDAGGRELVDLSDVSIEVDAEVITSEAQTIYGLTCREQNFETSYELLIADRGSGDVSAQIYKVDAEGPQPLLDPPVESDAIEQGVGATNRLRADCIGSELTFFVNGEQVGQVQDDSFEMGNVGVEVVAQAEEGDPPEVESEVAFDNFVLREA